MAISQAQSLLLLLVSLCFPSALCETTFKNCFSSHQYPINVTEVKISPDPVELSGNGDITITGFANKNISDGVTVNLRVSKSIHPVSRKSYSLCDITTCPVASGPIVLTFSNIFPPSEKDTATGYNVIIKIFDKAQKETMMCIVFGVKLGEENMEKQVNESAEVVIRKFVTKVVKQEVFE